MNSQLIKRLLGGVFWILFAMPFVAHFWIGGVVLDSRADNGAYLVVLREAPDVWVAVSAVSYWTYQIVDYAVFLGACGMMLWLAWRWLWHGSLTKNL
ncbi:hypothetical protein J7382_14650 [Shimia sp. R11_0]|uniref:hypothetical protein n=1 Tax=Shimia sp. R11_0 TaxID=2821096 RepID=UPI001ADC32FA|nr:hypothetical protein [Shimia sp. R11_0]MBO9478785.1 hypothetical protein [Shimia sp. R11_0]